jgi:hypothetical protein
MIAILSSLEGNDECNSSCKVKPCGSMAWIVDFVLVFLTLQYSQLVFFRVFLSRFLP